MGMTEEAEIRLDDFMGAANKAYYACKDPFADFVTAPEISQIFGELIAVWLITVMNSMPGRGEIALVEAGPGRGTLMSDILRIMRRTSPEFYERCRVYLIETSPRLKQIQKEALQDYGLPIKWLESVDALPSLPIIMVANEFLDALPIRQFTFKGSDQWMEHYVKQETIIKKPIKDLPVGSIFERPVHINDIVEVCESGQQIIAKVTQHLCLHGGAALFIDYGYASPVWGDTLQAIANQKKVSPLGPIGSADLTAHVDFAALKKIALQAGGKVYGIQTQGEFLRQLGILLRTKLLLRQASESERKEIMLAVHRLIDSNEMGCLFKVIAICNPQLPMPPAFEMVESKEF